MSKAGAVLANLFSNLLDLKHPEKLGLSQKHVQMIMIIKSVPTFFSLEMTLCRLGLGLVITPSQ